MNPRAGAFVGVVSLLALVAVVLGAIAISSDGGRSGAASPADEAQADTATALPQLAVFRRAATPRDAVPDGALSPGSARFAPDATQSRLAWSRDGVDVWLVPAADRGVCIGSTDHGVHGCVPDPALADPPAVTSVICSPFTPDDRILLYGVLADDVADPVLRFEDGTAQRVQTGENVFLADVLRQAPLPTALAWTDTTTGATLTVSTAVPADAARERCDDRLTPAEAEQRLDAAR